MNSENNGKIKEREKLNPQIQPFKFNWFIFMYINVLLQCSFQGNFQILQAITYNSIRGKFWKCFVINVSYFFRFQFYRLDEGEEVQAHHQSPRQMHIHTLEQSEGNLVKFS